MRAATESLKALGMERNQTLIVSHRDGQPGGPGEREGGGVEPQPAAPLEVGRGVRAGAGEDPVPVAGEEQQAAFEGGAGCGQTRAFGRALAAGEDEPVAGGAGNDPGGSGRMGRPEAGAGGLAAGGGAQHWERLQRRRGKALGELEKRSKREWSALYGRHQRRYSFNLTPTTSLAPHAP